VTGQNQRNLIRRSLERGDRTIPEGRFEGAHGRRVRCSLCHATGLGLMNPSPWSISPWQIPHVQEHLAPCKCGLTFLSQGHLNQHVKPGRYPYRSLTHGRP
jgi:hypothetical protein